MAIVFPEWAAGLFFTVIGEKPPQADEDLAYRSALAFESYAGRMHKLSDLLEESVTASSGALPPKIGGQ
ncbi:hypothetical protein, partial [Streptomyces violaceorubidus]